MRLLYSLVAVTGFASAVFAATVPKTYALTDFEDQALLDAADKAYAADVKPVLDKLQVAIAGATPNEVVKAEILNSIRGEVDKYGKQRLQEIMLEESDPKDELEILKAVVDKLAVLHDNVSKSSFTNYDDCKTLVTKWIEILKLEISAHNVKVFKVDLPAEDKVGEALPSADTTLSGLTKPAETSFATELGGMTKAFDEITGDPKDMKPFNDMVKSMHDSWAKIHAAFEKSSPAKNKRTHEFKLLAKKYSYYLELRTLIDNASRLSGANFEFARDTLQKYVPCFINLMESADSFPKLRKLTPLDYNDINTDKSSPALAAKMAFIQKYAPSSIGSFFKPTIGKIFGILVVAVIVGGAVFAFSGEEVIEAESEEKVADAPLPKKEAEKPKAKSTKPGAKKASKGKGALKKKDVKPKTA